MNQEIQKTHGHEKIGNHRSVKATKIAERYQNEVVEEGLRTTKRTASLFLKSSSGRGKWVAIFEEHLGILEKHVETLDQLMQSMKNDAKDMRSQERLDWELGERGHWRVICRMMDAARAALAQAREAAKGILPVNEFQNKKGLGLKEKTFESLEAHLQAKAESIGYDAKGKGDFGKSSSSVLDSNTNKDHQAGVYTESAPEQNELVKPSSLSRSSKKAKTEIAYDAEISLRQKAVHEPTALANDIFQGNCIQEKIKANRTSCEKRSNPKVLGVSSTTNPTAASSMAAITEKDIDFTALQIKLQEEVAAGEKAVQKARKAKFDKILGNNTEFKVSTSKKRRRRSSEVGGGDGDALEARMAEKKRRKEKKEMKKRKLQESEPDKELRHEKKARKN